MLGAALAKHCGDVFVFCVDLHFAAGFAIVAEGVWVDNRLNFLSLFEHLLIGCGEVTLLKGVLGGAMAEEQVLLLASLIELHVLLVILVLFLSHDHFLCFWLVCIGSS